MSKKAKKEECIVSEVVVVTPAMAKEWLKKNVRNRRLVPSKVDRFAAKITAGLWQTTHQGIAFYENDDLADGQHRLAAIVSAGKPVKCMVSYGLTPEANAAIDTGVARTLANNMQFLGHDMTRDQSAAYRVLYYEYRRQQRSADNWIESDRPEPQQFEKLYLGLKGGAMFATAVRLNPKVLAHSSFVGAVAAASFTRDRDRLADFLRVYSTGVAKDQTDSAAIRLREYMMTTELPRHVLGKQEVYLRCCTAITAFLEYRGLTKLYCRTDVAFPLPEVEGL